MSACTRRTVLQERARERDGGVREGEREEVQPAASKFGCNVTRPTSPDEVAIRAEIMRNKNTFLTSLCSPSRSYTFLARPGRSTMTLPDPPVQPAPCTGRGENTELVGSVCPSPPSSKTSRQQAESRGGREPPGSRQQAEARKLKAVV